MIAHSSKDIGISLSRRFWLALSICVIAYSVGLVFDVTPYLRGPDDWRWPRASVQHWDRLWPALIVIAVIAIWVRVLDRRLSRSTHPRRLVGIGIAVLIVAAVILQLTALQVERLNPIEVLFGRSVDEVANGYFTVGYQIADVGGFLRRYPELMPDFPIHPQVHPPGIPLIYWSTGSLLERAPNFAKAVRDVLQPMDCNNLALTLLPDARLASASAGMLIPVIANALTLVCVFKLAEARFGQRAGLYAAALWAAMPSAVLFAGNWSQVYPLIACLVWLLVDAGLARRAIGFFFVAGVILSLGTFMELGTAALGLFLVLYIMACYAIERRNPLHDWRFLAASALAGLAGVASIWLGYWLVYGVTLNQIVATMLPIHTGWQFDRFVWIFNRPYEYAVFMGLPAAGLLIVAAIRSLRAIRTRQTDNRPAVDALSSSLGLGLVILSIVDPARDEIARTWMMLMPFGLVVAAGLLANSSAGRKHFDLAWGLNGIQVLVMIVTLNVITLFPPPQRETVAALPAGAAPLHAEFGGMARLTGYQLDRSATDRWVLDLYWQAIAPVDRPYTVFNQVINEYGQIVGQHDGRPQKGELLMTCWQPGELYLDRHSIKLYGDLPAGIYTLETGVYDAVAGARLSVSGAISSEPDRLVLETITFP